MTYHTSTREREALLDAGFYTRIFEGLPPVRSVLDIACGLNPLCVPWMPLAPAAIYHALDVYADMASFLDRALDLLGIAHSTRVQDVLSGQPLPEVDLVFALKTIPCLEQVDKDAGSRLLATLRAGSVVISYPTRSVGGKNVGMAESYAERFATLTGGRPARRIDFDNEMVFVLHR
jgi:16S rRNA (guanine(1405)-N(7))-methyltransferase